MQVCSPLWECQTWDNALDCTMDPPNHNTSLGTVCKAWNSYSIIYSSLFPSFLKDLQLLESFSFDSGGLKPSYVEHLKNTNSPGWLLGCWNQWAAECCWERSSWQMWSRAVSDQVQMRAPRISGESGRKETSQLCMLSLVSKVGHSSGEEFLKQEYLMNYCPFFLQQYWPLRDH